MLGIFPRVLTISKYESIAAISAADWDFHTPNAITELPSKNIKPFCHYCFFCKQQTIPVGTQGTAGAKRRGKDTHHITFPLRRVMGAAPWDGNTNHQSLPCLALGLKRRGRNSQATQTHSTTLSCPPTCVKHVKFHLLPSTSTSGLQFPIATLSLEVLSQPLQLPAPNPPPPHSCLHKKKGRTVARNLFITSENSLQPSSFTCYIQMESGML